MKCSVFIATSLDGFIARPDGEIDWLDEANKTAPPGEDFGFRSFFDSVDVLIMGRKSLQKVLIFPEWPYGEKPIRVLSRTLTQPPSACPASVRVSPQTPGELLLKLEGRGHRHAYIDGGATIQSFLAEGLIEEMTITTIPVLLGSGIPLFGPLPRGQLLEHVSTKAFDCGFVQSTYRVRRDM